MSNPHSLVGDLRRRLLEAAEDGDYLNRGVIASASPMPALLREAEAALGEWVARFNQIMERQLGPPAPSGSTPEAGT